MKEVAHIFSEELAQTLNAGLTDDDKKVFTTPLLDVFYCTVKDAEELLPDGLGRDYEVTVIPPNVVDSTFPAPKRRKLPV